MTPDRQAKAREGGSGRPRRVSPKVRVRYCPECEQWTLPIEYRCGFCRGPLRAKP